MQVDSFCRSRSSASQPFLTSPRERRVVGSPISLEQGVVYHEDGLSTVLNGNLEAVKSGTCEATQLPHLKPNPVRFGLPSELPGLPQPYWMKRQTRVTAA